MTAISMTERHGRTARRTGNVGYVKKVLLSCGILSSLLYIAMTVFVAMQWEGYNSASQTISELSAIGAPTRPMWVPLGFLYMLLVAAFGWGVFKSAGRVRPLRAVGSLIIAYGALGLLWPFASMHLHGLGAPSVEDNQPTPWLGVW
jgi:hypothetical protein